MEKFLVTGGAGFIGSNLCRRLVADGCFVRVVDNLLTGKEANLVDVRGDVDFICGDIGDPDVAVRAMEDIDVVLHHAALPSVPSSVDDPVLANRHCIDATQALGGTNLIGPIYSAVGRTWTSSDEERARDTDLLVEQLKELSAYAIDHGVVMGLEPLNRFETSFRTGQGGHRVSRRSSVTEALRQLRAQARALQLILQQYCNPSPGTRRRQTPGRRRPRRRQTPDPRRTRRDQTPVNPQEAARQLEETLVQDAVLIEALRALLDPDRATAFSRWRS